MGKVNFQTACPRAECGSSDAFTAYHPENGRTKPNAYCYSCDTYFEWSDDRNEWLEHLKSKLEVSKLENWSSTRRLDKSLSIHVDSEKFSESLQHPIRELKERGISYNSAERYGVRVGVDTRDGVTPIYYLIPRYKNGELSGFVKKTVNPKSYSSIGDVKDCDLFGLNVIPKKGKKIFITEGFEDCLSVYQVLKNSTIEWEPAVVALLGSNKVNSIIKNMDVLDSYDEVILVLDQDKAGREAAENIAKLFPGKSYIAKYPFKDPNEMLLAGKGEDLKWTVLTGARKYQPDGIVNAKDLWERYKSTGKVKYYPFPDSMPLLNKKLYGAKEGTVITIGAGTSIGKTTIMRELKYHYLTTTEEKIADIELEADVTETLKSIVGLKLNKRILLPDVEVTEEEEFKAYEDLFSTGRYTLYDYFGGMDDDNLFNKLRYFAHDHKFIFLDHLSIIVSEYAAQGGERERIDTIMTKLAKLAKETGVIIFLVVHLKKSDSANISFEQGAVPNLDDLRGSSTIKQLSWDVVFLSRNTQHPDPECAKITELTSAKCRLTGDTGNAGYIKFDTNTGRYVSCTPPPNYKENN